MVVLLGIYFADYASAMCCGGYFSNGCVDCNGEVNNFYGKILGGYNFFKPEKVKWGGSRHRTRYKEIKYKGLIISTAFGYHFCYGWRVEGEFAFRRNPFSKVHILHRTFSRHAHLETYSYMANLIWEVPLALWTCETWRITPFIGAGIGYDKNKVCGTKRDKIEDRIGVRPTTRKDSFAWQVMAGLDFPITRDLDLTVEYKFHKAPCMWNQSYGVGLSYKFLYGPNY